MAAGGAVRVARILRLIARTRRLDIPVCEERPCGRRRDGLDPAHLPNLVFHEAGHIILGVFGRFVGVLGGSLFQFAVPLVLAGAFLRQRDWFGAAVCVWWAGQNLLDLAPYIADARALQLVLLGGRTGAEVEGHDWEDPLGELNLLHMDRTLGLTAHRLGLVMMTAALDLGERFGSPRTGHSTTFPADADSRRSGGVRAARPERYGWALTEPVLDDD